jgi:hypothetical protein
MIPKHRQGAYVADCKGTLHFAYNMNQIRAAAFNKCHLSPWKDSVYITHMNSMKSLSHCDWKAPAKIHFDIFHNITNSTEQSFLKSS